KTIEKAVADIAQLPTPFNAYVALSRSRGRDGIALLREFNEKLFTTRPNERLRREDERLNELYRITTEWWTKLQSISGVLSSIISTSSG
ncbi:hypothetical protein EV363DRAFT_1203322, partial [Boletus edulis]